MLLQIKRADWEAMRTYVGLHAPLEACGLLAGRADLVEKVLFITNQAQSPVRFRMDPRDQLQAFNRIETEGLDLLAIFHSHPAGPETVSHTDRNEAAYPVVQLIWSRPAGFWQARGFWIGDRVSEVRLQIIGQE